jgi:hypothetical protein
MIEWYIDLLTEFPLYFYFHLVLPNYVDSLSKSLWCDISVLFIPSQPPLKYTTKTVLDHMWISTTVRLNIIQLMTGHPELDTDTPPLWCYLAT